MLRGARGGFAGREAEGWHGLLLGKVALDGGAIFSHCPDQRPAHPERPQEVREVAPHGKRARGSRWASKEVSGAIARRASGNAIPSRPLGDRGALRRGLRRPATKWRPEAGASPSFRARVSRFPSLDQAPTVRPALDTRPGHAGSWKHQESPHAGRSGSWWCTRLDNLSVFSDLRADPWAVAMCSPASRPRPSREGLSIGSETASLRMPGLHASRVLPLQRGWDDNSVVRCHLDVGRPMTHNIPL
jgi:hypothetical protein